MIPMMKTIRLMKVLDHQGKGLLTSDDKVMEVMITHLSGMAGSQANCPLRLFLKSLFLVFSECASVCDLSVHIVGLWDDLRPIGWTTSRAQSIAPPAQRLQC